MTGQKTLDLVLAMRTTFDEAVEQGMSEGDALSAWFGAAVGACIARNVDPAQLHATIDELVKARTQAVKDAIKAGQH